MPCWLVGLHLNQVRPDTRQPSHGQLGNGQVGKFIKVKYAATPVACGWVGVYGGNDGDDGDDGNSGNDVVAVVVVVF